MLYCMTVVKHVHLFPLQCGGCLYSVYTRDLLMSARGTDYIGTPESFSVSVVCPAQDGLWKQGGVAFPRATVGWRRAQ